MGKTAGGIRNSKWKGDIYTVAGTRYEYKDLPPPRKVAVQKLSKKIGKAIYRNLSGKTVTLDAGGTHPRTFQTTEEEHAQRRLHSA